MWLGFRRQDLGKTTLPVFIGTGKGAGDVIVEILPIEVGPPHVDRCPGGGELCEPCGGGGVPGGVPVHENPNPFSGEMGQRVRVD